MCNCEYCIKCETCGHKADEHIAGEGHCFKCKCPQFRSRIDDAWRALPIALQTTTTFQEFANDFIAAETK